MKKKFIAVSVLLCALALSSTTLTSCVDDNESASVTAIRDAKAAQLTALANYQQAQADAKKIISEANAAIKNAEAKAKEIANELQNIALEKAKATLATDLETAQAQAEAALLSQKAALERAKASLIAASNTADEATKNKINELLNKADELMYGYWDYANVWNPTTQQYEEQWVQYGYNSIYGEGGLNERLISKKAERVKADYELVDIQLQIAEKVRQEEKSLAVNEALLAEYKKYDNTDKDAAEKAANEASQKLPALQQLWNEAQALYYQEYNEKIRPALENIYSTELYNYIYGNTNGSRVWDYLTMVPPENETITVNFDDGTSQRLWLLHNVEEDAYEVNQEALSSDITNADRAVKVAEQNLTNAEKAQTDGLKDAAITDDGVTTYKELKDAVTEAQKAFDKEPTNANKSTLEYAESRVKSYENLLQSGVDRAQEALDSAKEEQTILAEINTLLTGEAFKNYTTVYKAYVAAVEASTDKFIAMTKAEHNYTVQNNLVDGLNNIANSYTDWLTTINVVEKNINTNKKNIATMTADDGVTTEATKQQYMEILDQEIASLEKEIEIKQAQYNSYIEQIQSLIAGDTVTEEPEETPAE